MVRKKEPKKNALARRSMLRSLLPRSKKGRKEAELFGGAGVAIVSALVVSIFIGSSVDRYFITSQQYASVLATVLVDLTNGDRTQNSLTALTLSPALTAVAQAKANDMAAKSYFAHISPEGIDPWHWFTQEGYAFDYAGENLAVDFSESSDVERAWMNSPTHRENILNPKFTEIGIAIAEGTYRGRRTTFVAQVFGTPSSSGVQRALAGVSIPESPSEIALATSAPSVLGEVTPVPVAEQEPAPETSEDRVIAQGGVEKEVEVLGTAAEEVPAPAPEAVKPSKVAPPVTVVAGSTPNYASIWAHIAASPRSMMQYLYWTLAILIVIALGVATEWEIRLHHTRKAVAAGVMLSFILAVLVAADSFVFLPTLVTPQATMASAAAALP